LHPLLPLLLLLGLLLLHFPRPSSFAHHCSYFCSMSKTVDLLDLAAAAVSSTILAAHQIRALAMQRDGGEPTTMNVRLKEDGSFLTDADLVAQQIIVQALKKISPDIRLVGEESDDEMNNHIITGHEEEADRIFGLAQEEIRLRYQDDDLDTTTTRGNLPLSHTTNGAGESETGKESNWDCETAATTVVRLPPMTELVVDTNRVSVFIDPLDGTSAYARGDFPPVSILIAIILDQVPCFGVICKPFGYPGQTPVLDTGCVAIYGGTLLGAAYTAGGGYCTKATIPSEPSDDVAEDLPRAVISSSRSGGIVEEFVSHLGSKGMIHPTPLHISGAGEKSLRILLRSEQEGLWFFPKPGTSLWDVAASDALLRATGGRLTDKNGRDMDYSKSRLEAENLDGVVACYDHSLHAECIKLFLEGTWTTKS
jgi:3'-phosphoadenosine 5'-phosphosulfate (PAPS) 3'-phosphatase